ncbi:MAG TPA: hypothetical protein VFX92_07465 [Candidatus Krumholzibacteria bacterium]|nr:hypothetical protein [Candidatus Krumholzibacteria bacterium]
MNVFRLMVAVAACTVIGACGARYSTTVPGPIGPTRDAELAVQELMLRNLVPQESDRDIVLVGVGESRLDCADPSPALLERFAGTAPALVPVSAYDGDRHPNALLIVLGPAEWTSGSEGAIAVTRVRFGAGGSDGFTARVAWKDETWKVVGTSRHWST